MGTVVPLLVIGVALCFVPAKSYYHKDGKEGAKSVPSCLQKAMAKNNEAVDGVIQFMCLCKMYKDMTNKEELIKATQYLENVTGCRTEDIFGSDTSREQVARDENGVLTGQILTMEELLKDHVPLPITTAVCALLNDIGKLPDFVAQSSKGEAQGNKRTTRNVLGLVGGLAGSLEGITGLLKLLGLIGKLVKLLEPIIKVLEVLLGGLGGVTNLLGGLGSVTGALGGVTGLLG